MLTRNIAHDRNDTSVVCDSTCVGNCQGTIPSTLTGWGLLFAGGPAVTRLLCVLTASAVYNVPYIYEMAGGLQTSLTHTQCSTAVDNRED